MSKIPADYLPPKELWAEYTAPEEFKQFTVRTVEYCGRIS